MEPSGEARHYVSPEHSSRGIKDLPQFPVFMKNVHVLHKKINLVSKQENDARYARQKATALNPEDVKETRYSTNKSWSDFVLHDAKGVVAPFTMVTSLVNGVDNKTEEAKSLVEMGRKVTASYKDEALPLSEKIRYADQCLHYFSGHIDSIVASTHGQLDPYLSSIDSTKNHLKVWDMVVRSAQMLKGVKNENYDQISKWFNELQKTQVTLGDIFAVAAKNVEITQKPPGLFSQKVDGVKGMMLFNLIKNADAYKKSRINVSLVDGTYIVENDLNGPFDDSDLFKPMEPKKTGNLNGNTGFGLFTVKNIYGTLSGNDVTCEGSQSNGSEPATIRFVIKKSQPTDIESLPLPPAQ